MSDPIPRLNAALEGRYRVERPLGEGGTATVYLAQDLRHGRSVALKVLRPELAAVVGAERFLAEIRTTATLQHPHILPLFDSGEAGPFLFFVMPYVEGESLQDRLSREKQLPVDEALRIAVEVADALDYAHRQGVVHRDVKPGNILLQDNRPVVTDFGIALAVSEAGAGRLTETGLSLGTPYYMSPEQAMGDREVDARSDIYGLSCVLYEMLTGEPPFVGSTAQAVLGRILMGEPPPPTEHRKTIPDHVESAVLRGLARLPADRFPSVADFARALSEPTYATGPATRPRASAATRATRAARAARSSRRRTLAELAVGGLLLAALGLSLLDRGSETPPVNRQQVTLGSGIEAIEGAVGLRTALAPDGSGVLFGDTAGTFWWKPTGQTEPVRVADLDGAVSVVFSPDAEWLAYVAEGQLRKRSLRGGSAMSLVDSISWGEAHALTWLEDGTIVLENTNFVMQAVPDDGSTPPRTITSVDDVGHPLHASGLPGGGAFLLSACPSATCSTSHLYLIDLAGPSVHQLATDVSRAWPAPEERIVYADRGGTVLTASLDREAGRLGPAVPLFAGIRGDRYKAEIQVGNTGTVLFVAGSSAVEEYEAVRVTRDGQAERIDPEWRPGGLGTLALAPDGHDLAVSVAGAAGEEIWIKNLPAGPFTRLTEAGERPVWTTDGRFVTYVTNDGGREHIRRLPADRSSSVPDTVLARDDPVWEVLFHERGVLFREGTTGGGAADLRFVRGEDGEVVEILATEFDERGMALSPDGRWLAYVSNANGRDEVFVRPFPESRAGSVQVSTNGGTEPMWATSGGELFYRDAEGWMNAASVSDDPAFAVGTRTRLFDASRFRTEANWHNYSVGPDGFIMLRAAGSESGTREADRLVLVEGFFQEVEAAVAR